MRRRGVALAAAALLVSIALLSLASAATSAPKHKVFNIVSPDVRDGGKLARKFAGNLHKYKGCDGGNVSPALRWTHVPNGTKSFAIVMFDPVPNAALGFVHWVAYDIPADKASLKEGEASRPSAAFKGGKNGTGGTTYFGPCPPIGDKAHPYVITLIATDLAPGNLKPGLTRDELGAALSGHVKGQTSLVARYGH